MWGLWISPRCIFSIYVSKNEVVCHEVHTHFGSCPLERFTKIFLGAFSRFMRPNTKLFAVKFRRILEVFSMQTICESYGCILTIDVSKNEAVCREVQMYFGSFHLMRFMKQILGAFSRFMRLKKSCLPWNSDAFGKFSASKVYRKKSWVYFHDLCAACTKILDFKIL